MEGLGRVFNTIPIAAGKAFSLRDAAGVTFICTGNDTFTVTVASSFAGSYATPGNIITKKITNTATDGTAAWVSAPITASNAIAITSGTLAFYVGADMLPDGKDYIKCSVGAAGLVHAVLHDLNTQRKADNLAILGA